MLHAVITITGNRVYQLGETSGIRCSTEVPVQSIQWLDESSGVVRQGTSVQELVLDLTIAARHNNSRYTCRVSQGTFVASEMINIRTGRKIKRVYLDCNAQYLSIAPPVVALSGGGPQIAGENYTLTCLVTGGGITTPTYRWFRDGSLLTGQRSATLSFSPLRETDSGVYTCEGTRSSITRRSQWVTIAVVGKLGSDFITISHYCTYKYVAPELLAVIAASGPPFEGSNYTLTCQVSGDELLATINRSFMWNVFGDMVNMLQGPAHILTFNPLTRSDTGEYRCTATITSPYLIESRRVMGSKTVTVNCK